MYSLQEEENVIGYRIRNQPQKASKTKSEEDLNMMRYHVVIREMTAEEKVNSTNILSGRHKHDEISGCKPASLVIREMTAGETMNSNKHIMQPST